MMVATAATVAEALTFFKSRDFDLVVTNLLGRGTGTTMSKEMMSLMPRPVKGAKLSNPHPHIRHHTIHTVRPRLQNAPLCS